MSSAFARDPNEIASRADFAQALSELRERAHLSVRQLARRIGIPPGTLGDYFSGRHLPSPAQVPQLRRLLAECGVDTEIQQDAWLDALRRVRSATARRAGKAANPYPGLRPFDSTDADVFFGRDADTAEIVRLLAGLLSEPGLPSTGLLVVVGASGSGKSSLLRAGVLPAVRAGALGAEMTGAVITPGRDLAVPTTPQLLVVDQLEEVFSAEVPEEDRANFFRQITQRPSGTLTVVALRADFYPAAMREPALLPALQHAQVLLAPLTPADVRSAIVEPARRRDATVEPGLVDLLVAALRPHELHPQEQTQLGHDPGALPLLNHCLHEAWEHCDGTTVTVADYQASGGIEGSVQQAAEQAYRSLDAAQQALARGLFLRLVNVERDIVATRRRLPRAELDALGEPDRERLAAVLDTFVGSRLIAVDASSAQLTHEALITAWPRLRLWLEDNHAGQQMHRQLTNAANEWADAGRDDGALLRGGRLAGVAEWAADQSHADELNPRERDFLQTSLDAELRERQTVASRARRLRRLLAACVVLALVAAGLAAYAWTARSSADRARLAASNARDDALSRQVAIEAQQLAGTDPALAQQLAVAAYRIAPTDEARGTLIASSDVAPITRVLGRPGPTPLAVSAARSLIAVGRADDGSVHLYRAHAGSRPTPAGVAPGRRPAKQLFALAFTPNGRVLVTAGQPSTVDFWDVAGDHPALLAAAPTGVTAGTAVQAVAISPDGRRLAVAGEGAQPLQLWDISRPGSPKRLPPPVGIPAKTILKAVEFSPDGRQLAAGADSGDVLRWPVLDDAPTGPPAVANRSRTVNALAFTPDSATLFAGDTGGVITGYRRGTTLVATQTLRNPSGAQINVLLASPRGGLLFAGSSDDTVSQWDLADGTQVATTPNPGPVTGLATSRGGTTLLDTAADGALRLTRTTQPALPVAGTVFSTDFDADGDRLAVVHNGPGAALQLWDVRAPEQPKRLGPQVEMARGIAPTDGTGAISPDGEVVAIGDGDGYLELCDETTPAQPRPLGRPFRAAAGLVESVAFSPDGKLLAVGADDHSAHLWDVADPAHPVQLASLRGGDLMLAVAFGDHGDLLAGGNADKSVRIWNIADPRRPRLLSTLRGPASYIYGVAFSPNSRVLAATSADQLTRLWDVATPSRPRALGQPLGGPNDYVNAPSFSPDGRLLAVGSNDHTVWLYDVADPAHATSLATLRGIDGNVFATAFSPDGRTLAAGGRSANVLLWTVNPATDIANVCRAAGDPITRAEWRRFAPGAPYRDPCR
ncbi:helix-turn-helix domain-containing protein [uncultured Jatrophihabitans sp.]|uniref:nSTAND1 domain-containing NTPase n=1 Tax=uncultured Jatrophihabitans sp. TaxID=1610747 RepID=UPI0035CA2281